MDLSGFLRRAAVAGTAAVLLAGCSSSGSDPDPDPSGSASEKDEGAGGSRAGSTTRTLDPLPAEIPSELTAYYDQKLDWSGCGTPGFQCATLRVPLDYANAEAGEDIELAVVRKKATGPGKRLGSLQVNPGGPGASGVEFVENFAGLAYPDTVRARYDIVAADPRGVGGSQPVECLTDAEFEAHTQVDQTPDDAKEIQRLSAAFEKFAKGCEQRNGDLLGHVSTVEAARDMDILRAATGDKKLSYVGASYGTMLGATYAGLFPERAGRLVLDGAMDPSLSSYQLNLDQNAGFTVAFDAFAKDCVERENCPLGTKSAADAGQRLRALLDRLDRKPIPTGESRKLGEPLATMGVLQSMYAQQLWPQLRDALDQAIDQNNGSGLLTLADQYYERQPDGSYGSMMYAFAAVNCVDQPAAFNSPDDVKKAVPAFEEKSPVFGRDFAWAALNCDDWPVKATGEANRIEAKGADPILVVGTTRDPATPYRWSEALAGQLDSGVLLTYEGDGHTAYLQGNSCIDSAINTYLLRGSPPENKTRCD